ncbi:MAG: hypothetical protein ACWA5T_08010 [Parvularcula sp.]
MGHFTLLRGTLAVAMVGLGAAACATSPYGVPETTVSVQFDPDDFDEAEMRESAISMCRAKGYQTAAPYTAQPTMARGTWDYKTFGCY